MGGYRLRSYEMIRPVLSKAACIENERLDFSTASIPEILAHLQGVRRDPGSDVALRGLPELSDVDGLTEPESTLSLMRSPRAPAETASPTKRRAGPTSSVALRASRLSDTMVKLLPMPTSSPKAEPSPTKLASAPSSPFPYTPAPRNIVATSPSLWSTGVVPAQQTSPRSGNESEVCRTSTHDDPSSDPQTMHELSPTKLRQPAVPTPSRWNRAESSNPQSKTPCRHGLGLGLIRAIPPSTPQLPASTLKRLDANDSASFIFGPISPSFNSPSWLESSITSRDPRCGGSGLKRGSRRKSEPLIRNIHRNQAAARRFLSPQKLSFSNTFFLNENNLGAIAIPYIHPSHKHLASAPPAGQRQGLDTPLMCQSPDVASAGTVTPAISWAKMTGRAPPAAAVQRTPPTNAGCGPDSVFNIDMRQNLDIFGGSQAASPEPRASAIEQLNQIGEDCCQAMAVVMREHGRLFARFKLPVEYVSMFPTSQGLNESQFTTTASAVSALTGIIFKSHDQFVDATVASPSSTHEQTLPATLMNPNEAVIVPTFVPPSHAYSSAVGETAHPRVDDAFRTILGSTDKVAFEEHSVATPQPRRDSIDNESSLSQDRSPRAHGQSDNSLTSPSRAPVTNSLATTGLASKRMDRTYAQQHPSTPTADDMAVIPTGSLNAATSFTPVNRSTPQDGTTQAGSASGASHHAQHAPGSACEHFQQQSYESPGRAYMREFIKRSKPKRLSATETGSPVAPRAKRQPLGAKSPNTESPQKGKRMTGSEKLDAVSPLKNRSAQKRSRRSGSMTSRAEPYHDMDEPETTLQPGLVMEQGATRGAKDAEGSQDDEEMGYVPASRRSSRLRNQGRVITTSKSSIPTAIKFGGPSGAGRGTLKLTSRTEQQDLIHQTRINTRKNRGNAEYPAQYLARQSPDEMDMDGARNEVVRATDSSNGRKCVGWKDPVEAHQHDKSKRGRPSKAQAIECKTSATKPKRASVFVQRQRTAKVAANLGMSANGTPAKVGRVTRSSTRLGE